MVAYTSTSRHSAIRAFAQQWICMEKRTQSRDVSSMGQFGFNGSYDGITHGDLHRFQTHQSRMLSSGMFCSDCTSSLFSFQNGMRLLRRTFSQTGNVTSGPALSFLNVNLNTELCCYERAGGHSAHCHSAVTGVTSISQQRESSKSFIRAKRNDERYG